MTAETRKPPSSGAQPSKPRSDTWAGVIVLLSFLVAVLCVGWRILILDILPAFSDTWRSPLDPRGQLVRYPGEKITWAPCGDSVGHLLECSSVNVPLDQFDVGVSRGKAGFNIPLIRLRAHNATNHRNLFVSPASPGSSGIGFMYKHGGQLNTIIGEGYHLISFDARGTNSSTPRATCYPQGYQQVSHLGRGADSNDIKDQSPLYVSACAETMGEHGKYINTPQIAADITTIADALGLEQIDFWGFSYGTILGQTFASLFPSRSRKFILDGVRDVREWYQSPFDHSRWEYFGDALRSLIRTCYNARESCPYIPLPSTSEEMVSEFTKLITDSQAFNVYINSTHHGFLNAQHLARRGVYEAIASPLKWLDLTARLSNIRQSNDPREAWLAYGSSDVISSSPQTTSEDAGRFIVLNDGPSGAEYFSQGKESAYDSLREFLKTQVWASYGQDIYHHKINWPLPTTHSFNPSALPNSLKPTEKAGNVLVLATELDPYTGPEARRQVFHHFNESQLVTVRGIGHGSVGLPSRCVAEQIRAFLYDDSAENRTHAGEEEGEADQFCSADGPQFVSTKDHAVGDNEEGASLYKAQFTLAREMEVTPFGGH